MSVFGDKTIIVTGASGLIGSNLVVKLLEDSATKVIAIGRSKKKLLSVFDEYVENKNLIILEHDISLPLNIKEPVDYVFHAAGPMEGKIIREHPMDVIKPNINGLINCLDFLKVQEDIFGKKGRLVVFSSVTVYTNNTDKDRTVSELDTEITERLNSVSAPYSQSKRFIEVIANAYSKQYGIDVVIGRFSTVYGFVKTIPDTAFFGFVKNALSETNILVNNPNIPKRDNIYIDDAVNGIIIVAIRGASREAYNISSNGDLGNYASIYDIAKAIATASGKIEVIINEPLLDERKPGLKLDNKKLKDLGWEVKISLEDGISEVLKKYKGFDIAFD